MRTKELGKQVSGNLYLHIDAIQTLVSTKQRSIDLAVVIAGLKPGYDFNVVKLSQNESRITLLNYPGFFEESFPILRCYWAVDIENGSFRFRTYQDSLNPPILHRKELLLSAGHPNYAQFEALTTAAEQIGMFDDTARIGFLQAWNALLMQKGYRVVDHQLVPLGNEESDICGEPQVESFRGVDRHLTALTRYGFSAPVQTLARFGLLDGSKSLFDYGCGRGDDLRGLRENGIDATGWDPYYAPNEKKRIANIVNLGFVINVIENPIERLDALQGAYSLTDELLVVSAMLANPDTVRGRPYGDGVLTTRNTFQKYFTQGELRGYLAEALDEEPIPVGPGIFYVFKDKDAEQRFMVGRQVNRRNILRLAHLSRPEKPKRRDKAEEKYQQHYALLESLWEMCLTLGRDPDRGEIPVDPARTLDAGQAVRDSNQFMLNMSVISANFGSLPAALRFIKSRKDDAEEMLETARQSRINDLSVYFAQLQFERRKPYRHQESRLQNDVKAFFGDYREAMELGRKLLFAAGKTDNIDAACRDAAEHGVGWLEDNESLTLPTELIIQLPPVLRTYVGCGLRLYGDATSADLIKIHIHSGKLTLMSFDDFTGKPLPRMLQRIKIKLREQDLDVFDYEDSFEPPYLYRKSCYINEEFPHYVEQIAFEESLEKAGLLNFSGYGPKPSEFDTQLAQARLEVKDFRLNRSLSIPDIDASCGRYFTFRQLIECGETQARSGIPNLPKEPESYNALYELAINILDPVIDYFGMIRLTYGFCSPELARQIKGRIAPKLDQHAAHELNRNGKPICSRLGAAVDFIVEDEDMEEVVQWISQNLPFDRIYIYGRNKPIHLSYGDENSRQIVEMIEGKQGRLIPKIRRI